MTAGASNRLFRFAFPSGRDNLRLPAPFDPGGVVRVFGGRGAPQTDSIAVPHSGQLPDSLPVKS